MQNNSNYQIVPSNPFDDYSAQSNNQLQMNGPPSNSQQQMHNARLTPQQQRMQPPPQQQLSQQQMRNYQQQMSSNGNMMQSNYGNPMNGLPPHQNGQMIMQQNSHLNGPPMSNYNQPPMLQNNQMNQMNFTNQQQQMKMPLSNAGKIYPPRVSMVNNPMNSNGPPIYICKVCDHEVQENEQSLMCDAGCSWWHHRRCTKLTEAAYNFLRQEIYAEWLCDSCENDPTVPLVKFKA